MSGLYNIRPVVVSFEELTAREEVLQKAGMLKGSNIFITEDLSRLSHNNMDYGKHSRHVKFTGPRETQGKSWRGL